MPAITKASGRAGTIGSTTAVMTSETTAPIKGRRRITTRAWVTDGFTSVTSVTRLKMVTRTGLGDTKPTVDSSESGREWSIGVPLPFFLFTLWRVGLLRLRRWSSPCGRCTNREEEVEVQRAVWLDEIISDCWQWNDLLWKR